MVEPNLELKDIYKSFGTATPAAGLSLSVNKGEFFTLLGPSGSGKSTVLRILAGLEQPDSGDVFINGEKVTHIPPWKRKIGMVFQQYANFPNMNVAENISYGLKGMNLKSTDISARVEELLALVGLEKFEARRVSQLSGGEQQRVAVARALAPNPRLLLLDEPLSALDEKIRREMQTELRNIQTKTETTFVYVTHDQEEAITMSDRVAVLNKGLCIQCDTPKEIFQKPRTKFVASFFRGCNILECKPDIGGKNNLLLAGQSIPLKIKGKKENGSFFVAIRGEAINILKTPKNRSKSEFIQLSGHLKSITYRGVYSEHQIVLNDGQILSATLSHDQDFNEGQNVTTLIQLGDIILLEQD